MADYKYKDVALPIKKYIEKVSEYFDIQKIYLFGSYASGKANAASDIDLAIISPSFSGNRFSDNVKLGILTWGIDTRIEPVGFKPEDFNNNDLLASEILANGLYLPID